MLYCDLRPYRAHSLIILFQIIWVFPATVSYWVGSMAAGTMIGLLLRLPI